MSPALRRTRIRRSGPRRKLVWARQAASVNVTAAASPAFAAPARVDLLANFVTAYGAALIGCTVVRIRGLIGLLETGTAGAAGIRSCFYIGDANDIVRGPNANDNAYDTNSVGKDYFGFEPFLGVGTQVQDNPLHGTELVGRMIDIKAQRKLEEVSQRLIMDVSAQAVAATTVPVSFDLSVLLMLP